tara:strand:- start:42 stop:680 length:639 start_codon:yes stop_codon:yes gene_type:complete
MVPMLMIGMIKDLKLLVNNEMRDAYIHGFKSASEEGKVNVVQKGKRLDIKWDQEDEDAIRVLQSGRVQTNSYNELSMVLSTKLNLVVADSIAQGRSINTTVGEMQKIVNTEVYKLRRIARTEIINVGNEGRLASYKKQEKLRKKPFKYTLVVASGPRTCDAHIELKSRIPAAGLLIDDLIQLQQSVGASHGLSLTGNSLLHPNQRTILLRVP